MHYNVQINVQQVGYEEENASALRRGVTPTPRAKRVVEVLSLKVTAADEQEAFGRARKMLDAATPKKAGVPIDPKLAALGYEDEEDEE